MTWKSTILAIQKAVPMVTFGVCYLSLLAIVLLS